MDISFHCQCGQNIVIDEAGAGQLVDCPKCGRPLEVPYKSEPLVKPPAPSQIAASPSETKQCPYCAETIKREAMVCRYCGRDIRAEKSTGSPANGKLLLWCAAVVILVVAVLGIGLWYRQKAEQTRLVLQQAERAKEEQQKAEQAKAAQQKAAQEEKDRQKAEADRQLAEDTKKAEIQAAMAEAAHKQAESYARIAVAAKLALDKINEIGSAINAGVNYPLYAQKVIEMAAPIDELASVVATETKVYPNADAEELVRLTRTVLARHKEARNLWNYEIYGGSTDPDLLATELTDDPGTIAQLRLKWVDKRKKAALRRLDIWEQALSNALSAAKVSESMARASDH